MNWWIRFGCFLTGWNHNILTQCSEASYKQLKKYTSALIILMIMWGFTGYSFAQRYVHTDLIGSVAVAALFVVIVIQIERQIILTVCKNRIGGIFRFFIAVIMSVLGSSVVDQIIFGQDIERKMIEITDRQVQEQLPMRLSIIDSKLSDIHYEIDSLSKVGMTLNEAIALKPTVSTVSTQIVKQPIQQKDGTIKMVASTSTQTTSIPNPQIEQAKALEKTLNSLKKQESVYTEKKLNMEDNLRKELSNNVGFLEELNAMIELMASRTEALIFYIIVFSFLISLELFIVTSKLSDNKSDYDLVVEHQFRMKEKNLQNLYEG